MSYEISWLFLQNWSISHSSYTKQTHTTTQSKSMILPPCNSNKFTSHQNKLIKSTSLNETIISFDFRMKYRLQFFSNFSCPSSINLSITIPQSFESYLIIDNYQKTGLKLDAIIYHRIQAALRGSTRLITLFLVVDFQAQDFLGCCIYTRLIHD